MMNTQTKLRRRISFTPIMLTSKSIRPVDRSDYELMRHERKISGISKARDDLTNFVFRNSKNYSRDHSPVDFKQDQSPDRDPVEGSDNENSRQISRKMTTPTVVKVEFQKDIIRNRRRVELKLKQLKQSETNQELKNQINRFIYFTNAKTFDQFTKMIKIGPTKRLVNGTEDQGDHQWKKYLDKYYLNIRKVKPRLRKEANISMLSPQQMRDMHDNIESNMRESASLINRFRSNSPVRCRSKCHSRQASHINEQKSQNLQSDAPSESLINGIIFKKIESDIMSRKTANRKQFFVFGLSESVNKSAQSQIKAKFETYKDFIFRINFTNGLYVCTRQESQRPLKFYVGFGNNSAIIKGIMRRRFWWQITQKMSDDVNFVWTQLKVSDFFKTQSNYLPKPKLKKKQQKEKGKKLAQQQQGSKVLMKGMDFHLWQRYYDRNAKHEQKGFENVLLRRASGLLRCKKINMVQSCFKLKVHNHLQCNYFLGNKKALFYSLRKYYELQGINPFQKIPLTFHITQGLADPDFQHFLCEFQAQNEIKKIDKQFRNIWIVKPGELTNRGRGITVCSTLDQIKIRLKAKQKNSNGTARTFIIQKYIEKPLLYQRRKFDIRHYMAISSTNGRIKGYWYAQGYIRTTSSEYNIKNTKDLFTHLTNDAVQKNGQDYGKYQKGNKVSYADFQKYLVNTIGPDVDFFNQILPQMKQLATDSIRATYSVLDPERKEHNFQIFGLDFMLDERLNVYLIQVNTNPCLQTSCPLLTKIITPLIQNLFKLCLDPLFPPPIQWPTQRKYNFGDNAFQDNKFTLVFDQIEDGVELVQLYKNADKIDSRMGDIFEQEEEYQDQQKQWNDEQQVKK